MCEAMARSYFFDVASRFSEVGRGARLGNALRLVCKHEGAEDWFACLGRKMKETVMKSQSLVLGFCLSLIAGCAAQEGDVAEAKNGPETTQTTAANAACEDESADEVVAIVGGQPLTLGAVDEAARGQLDEVEQKIFEIRYATLNQMVDERLLEAEATKRSVEMDQLFLDEVEAKVVRPSPNEIAAFYEENAEQMKGTLAEMSPSLEGYLMQERQRERMMAFIGELRASSGVEILLSPRRKDVVAGVSARKGSKMPRLRSSSLATFSVHTVSVGRK